MSGAREPGGEPVSSPQKGGGGVFCSAPGLNAGFCRQEHRPVAAEAHHAADSSAASGAALTRCLTVARGRRLTAPSASLSDHLGPLVQELPHGSVPLHQQRHGVAQRPLPHHDQRFRKCPGIRFSSFSSARVQPEGEAVLQCVLKDSRGGFRPPSGCVEQNTHVKRAPSSLICYF